jgi:uncharacterized protein YutE (UPF0331/DUF86 family)
MKYNGIIQRKLALLDQHRQRLEQYLAGVSLEDFAPDWSKRWMAERAVQLMVEIVIDVAERIVALENAGPCATAVELIETLVRLGILKSADPYRGMVRFRNLIVHRYETIDPAVVFDICTHHLGDFVSFRDEVDVA